MAAVNIPDPVNPGDTLEAEWFQDASSVSRNLLEDVEEGTIPIGIGRQEYGKKQPPPDDGRIHQLLLNFTNTSPNIIDKFEYFQFIRITPSPSAPENPIQNDLWVQIDG